MSEISSSFKITQYTLVYLNSTLPNGKTSVHCIHLHSMCQVSAVDKCRYVGYIAIIMLQHIKKIFNGEFIFEG